MCYSLSINRKIKRKTAVSVAPVDIAFVKSCLEYGFGDPEWDFNGAQHRRYWISSMLACHVAWEGVGHWFAFLSNRLHGNQTIVMRWPMQPSQENSFTFLVFIKHKDLTSQEQKNMTNKITIHRFPVSLHL